MFINLDWGGRLYLGAGLFYCTNAALELFTFQQLRKQKVDFSLKFAAFSSRMIFGNPFQKKIMQSRNSGSTVLIVLLIVFSFPIWIGLAGGLFGLVIGIFGAVIGVIAGVFGAILGAIGGIFGWFFDWSWPFNGFFHWNIFGILIIALVVVLISRSRRI